MSRYCSCKYFCSAYHRISPKREDHSNETRKPVLLSLMVIALIAFACSSNDDPAVDGDDEIITGSSLEFVIMVK